MLLLQLGHMYVPAIFYCTPPDEILDEWLVDGGMMRCCALSMLPQSAYSGGR